MAKNASQAMLMLSKIGFSLQDINFSRTMQYKILHKYKPVVYVPLVAIEDNITFIVDGGERNVETIDNVVCKVIHCDIVNIIDKDEEIVELYGIHWSSLLKAWHQKLNGIRSVEFFRLELNRIEL